MSDEPNEEKTAMSATEDIKDTTPAPVLPTPSQHSAYAEEDDFAEDAWEDEQQQEQPTSRRPRRKLLTPLTALLFAVLVGAGGFIAGVQVEKGEVPASSGARGAGRLAALGAAGAGAAGTGAAGAGAGASSGTGAAGGAGRFAGGASGFGGGAGGSFGAGGGSTVGQVANISGSDLYVTNLEGNTIKVLADAAQITKQVNTSVKGVHPGDTVIVAGTKNSDGSIQAATVRDSGSSGAGGGAGGLFGGSSGAGSGGSSSGGSSGTSGRGASTGGGGEPALFGR